MHRKVQCWIFSKNFEDTKKCLLLRTIQARGGFWQPVTGSVEENEGYFQAACRESMEETGFIFSGPPIDTGFEFDFVSRLGPTKERVFGIFVEETPNPKLDPKEHQDFQWIESKKAIKFLKYPSNKEALKKVYKLLFQTDLNC